MNRFICLAWALVISVPAISQLQANDSTKKLNLNFEYYETLFKEIEGLLKNDQAQIWQKELYGPILIIDPKTRIFVANQNNKNGEFKPLGKVFTDTLPTSMNIANTAVDWGNTRWTMVMTPLPKNVHARNNLIIHELFHRIQPEIGFDSLNELSNNHLDTYDGRILLKLELEALKSALNASQWEQSKAHIANALTFRAVRQGGNFKKRSENSLEINEGLAEYTGIILSGRSDYEISAHLSKKMDRFYSNKTFVRSFAYQTIPTYGFLLAGKNPDWQREITGKTILTDYFTKAFSLQPQEEIDYKVLAQDNNYNFHRIEEVEKVREDLRLAAIEAYKKTFVEGPTLFIPFKKMNISFDPRNITPLEDYGTIYPNMRVTDSWGILTVSEGALMSPNWSSVTVSQPTSTTPKKVEGKGWKLELNEEWVIEKTGSKFTLKEKSD